MLEIKRGLRGREIRMRAVEVKMIKMHCQNVKLSKN